MDNNEIVKYVVIYEFENNKISHKEFDNYEEVKGTMEYAFLNNALYFAVHFIYD